jgi:hypothetical protein
VVEHSLNSTLQYALNLLRSNGVAVDSAAHNIDPDGHATAIILLAYVDEKPKAVRLLTQAGVQTER